jgi:hypothetical protein
MYKLSSFLLLIISIALFSCKEKSAVEGNNSKTNIDSFAKSENPYVTADQSWLDISWFPINYPIEKMKGNDSLHLIAKLIYSRPHKKGRILFGESKESLCAYGVPWRLGANEATEIELFENVNIAGTNILKGTYVLYCIPHADRWTIIFNSNLHTWGLHINPNKDIFKTDIPVLKQEPALEDFTMVFKENNTGADLIMAWDNVKTVLPFVFSK